MSQEPLIKLVFECVNSIISEYSSSVEVVKKVRTRARSIPEETFVRGLAYTLTFVASKSGKDFIEAGLSAPTCKDAVKKSSNTTLSAEELSYGIYGAALLYIAKKMGIIKGDKFEHVIYEILEKPAIESKMWNVLDWLKRVVEAYIYE